MSLADLMQRAPKALLHDHLDGGPLLDAEAVLLVYDHQREPLEGDPLRQ